MLSDNVYSPNDNKSIHLKKWSILYDSYIRKLKDISKDTEGEFRFSIIEPTALAKAIYSN